MRTFTTERPMAWEYETRGMIGRCRISDDELHLIFRFKQRTSSEFFDTVTMEWLLQQHLDATLTTVEEIAVVAKDLWPKLEIEVEGVAESHGIIRVRL